MRVGEGKGRERRVDWGWGLGMKEACIMMLRVFQCDYNGPFIPKSED